MRSFTIAFGAMVKPPCKIYERDEDYRERCRKYKGDRMSHYEEQYEEMYAKRDVPIREVGKTDPVNHPKHYTEHPSGVECIQITEHMGFNLGNAIKYIWRADLKNDAIEDLKKAAWYIERELKKRGA